MTSFETIANKRYVLHDLLGQGGMGSVYRATDRLLGKKVAFKRILLSNTGRKGSQVDVTAVQGGSHNDLRLAMAQEFQTLASLRHPHIISVLDYGFDRTGQPYLTMELLEEAQTLREATAGRPLAEKVDLLIQISEALTYLHRRGIIHRDLKPENVMVIERQAKVLDFGLAQARDHVASTAGGISGTLSYLAPEVVKGRAVSEASDFYALGVMAYEVLVERPLYQSHTFHELFYEITEQFPDTWSSGLPAPLSTLLDRLLDKDPQTRLTDGRELAHYCAQALDRPELQTESRDIRESFLQAAAFVGREKELSVLQMALRSARMGRGSAWLIGGESGVGKSRLLQEIRVQAMVEGAQVMQGQATEDAHRLPFSLWREVLRRLALTQDLDDLSAGVLRDIVPDIGRLLDRPVSPPPPLEGSAVTQRFYGTVTQLFRQQDQWTLLLLEDLHWADESLELLNQLTRIVADLPLIIMATYRPEERATLPQQLPHMKPLPLSRFDDEDIMALTTGMLGEAGRQPDLLSFLKRETEGNTFFLVEVVRALAEEAGSLQRINGQELPTQLFPEGITSILERRLARLGLAARQLLPGVAVAGRILDLKLLRKIFVTGYAILPLDSWLLQAAEAAIIEIFDGRWRFTHDKFRAGVLRDLPLAEKQRWHRLAAEGIESLYPSDPEQAASLSYHWGEVGERDLACLYAVQAGDYARRLYRHDEALHFFDHALTLLPPDEMDTRFVLHLSKEKVFSLLGKRDAQKNELDLLHDVAHQLYEKSQSEWRPDVLLQTAKYQIAIGEFVTAIQTAQNAILIAGDSNNLAGEASGFLLAGEAFLRLGRYEEAQDKLEIALDLAHDSGLVEVEGDSQRVLGVSYLERGQFDEASRYFQRALKIYEEIKEKQGEGTILNNLGIVAQGQGQLDTCLAYWEKAQEIYREIGDREGSARILTNLCSIYLDGGNYERALTYGEQALQLCEEINVPFGICFNLTNLSLVYHFLGQDSRAEGYSLRAQDVAQDLGSRQLQGYALRDYTLILTDQERLDEAREQGQKALQLWEELSQSQQLLEARAALAQIALLSHDLAEAETQIRPVVNHLLGGQSLDGTAKPFRIYLTCFWVLQKQGNPAAFDLLTKAHDKIIEQSGRIADPRQRELFCQIQEHRHILGLARQFATLMTS